ncbi:MAG TPA: 3'(2'),5'-bisphosphate nucleotidase CysQ [Acidimicrobiales bacterium]|nr:3'(2'),5'-bisphosphate nucleotidase CysQ [Acidimicrobiales bacterium]
MSDDHADAALLADEAGRLLIELRRRIGAEDAAAVKDEGDRRSHELLVARLGQLHPGDAVLSEEAADDPARVGAARVWVIDPLDGTREFGEPPRTDWAVHVALVCAEAPVAGAVALPARGLVLSTGAPPAVPPATGRPRLVVSRTRPPASTAVLAEALGAELVPMGSAGAKAMAIVLGEADVYAHSGGQHEWDSAAPVAVAQASGLHCSRLDGSPLRYNQPDPWLPDLLICRPELAERVIAALR